MRRQKVDNARACLVSSNDAGAHLFEPKFNLALMHYKLGDLQEAHTCVQKSLALYPHHAESVELLQTLKKLYQASF